MKFSERIKSIREENEFSREDLARELSVKPKEIAAWEEERVFPDADVLRRISDRFEVKFEDLFTPDDIITERTWQDRQARKMSGFSLGFLLAAILLTVSCYYFQITWFGFAAAAMSIAYFVFAVFAQPRYRRVAKRGSYVMYLVTRGLVLLILLMILVIMIRWQGL